MCIDDSQHNKTLVIQDKMHKRKQSFANLHENRETKLKELIGDWRVNKKHCDSSVNASNDEKKSFGWCSKFYDKAYFVINAGKLKGYKPGEQIFLNYG
mmetsp:Transcript_19113/g.22038  ORF Transcript_19113/g.22038 Transcript_19113/m.22038 type:complete len:98 (+) Transcript_19113:965-1258(+)